jgi:membrane associated rhomboid family serine protease
MRAGAMVRGQVDGGEWWRIITFNLVHVGGVHLIVNFIGLWFVGRLVEELFGPWRTMAIFGAAGIAGAVASYLASPAGVAAGASAGIFGLLGAVFVELTWHRRHHRAGRALWGSVAVVLIAQIGLGWVYPVVDQWAHGGGLVAGLVLGLVLSPNTRWSKLGLHAARVIAVAFGLAAAVATFFAARTSIADSFAHAPRALHSFGGLQAVAPASWQTSSDELFDPDLFILLAAHREAPTAPFAAQLDAYIKGEPKRAKDRNFDDVETAKELLYSLPAGWQGSELAVSVADPLGGRQRYRVLVAGRPDPTGPVLISLYAPETVVRAAPELFTQLLATLQ